MRQFAGMGAAEQVRPPGRAVQQRPAGEHRVRVPGGLERIRQVGEGVPRRGQDPHPHGRADLDDVPVADRHPVEGHLVGRVDVVRRPGGQASASPPVT